VPGIQHSVHSVMHSFVHSFNNCQALSLPTSAPGSQTQHWEPPHCAAVIGWYWLSTEEMLVSFLPPTKPHIQQGAGSTWVSREPLKLAGHSWGVLTLEVWQPGNSTSPTDGNSLHTKPWSTVLPPMKCALFLGCMCTESTLPVTSEMVSEGCTYWGGG
jgi:hypothetical protein